MHHTLGPLLFRDEEKDRQIVKDLFQRDRRWSNKVLTAQTLEEVIGKK